VERIASRNGEVGVYGVLGQSGVQSWARGDTRDVGRDSDAWSREPVKDAGDKVAGRGEDLVCWCPRTNALDGVLYDGFPQCYGLDMVRSLRCLVVQCTSTASAVAAVSVGRVRFVVSSRP